MLYYVFRLGGDNCRDIQYVAHFCTLYMAPSVLPSKDEAQTALFKDPVRTAL